MSTTATPQARNQANLLLMVAGLLMVFLSAGLLLNGVQGRLPRDTTWAALVGLTFVAGIGAMAPWFALALRAQRAAAERAGA